MPATTAPSTRPLPATCLTLALCLALLLTAGPAPAPARAGVHPDADQQARAAAARHWAGYRIPATGRAAGGWIGGYRIGSGPAFVVTPGRRPNRAGFRGPRRTNDLNGRRGPSRKATARAAWILSKYGGYRDDTQAAAVDAAVLHLLAGGRWRIGGRAGALRVRASGDRATVRRYARVMLRQARASAGRYRVSVSPSTADVGGVTSVTVRVTDGRGGPVSGLPVRVTSPDGGASTPAAGPADAITADDGRAVVRLAAPQAGWRTVVARVRKVPEHRLVLRPPRRKHQAVVAEGGVRRTLVATARVAVRGQQSLAIDPSPATLVLGGAAAVTATVDGGGAPRGATASLHGPFSSRSEADCAPAPVATTSATVKDGTQTMPSVAPGAGGYYAWRVAVDATPTSMPVAGCGAVVKVRGRASLSVSAPASAVPDEVVSAEVTLGGLPFAAPVEVTTSLYGPYTTAGEACTGNRQVRAQRRPGNGTFTSLSFQIGGPGFYVWRASVPEGDLWVGADSVCGAVGTLTQVG